MTVLVTGGTGFLGRFIVRQLVARGDRVRALGRTFDAEFEELGVEQQLGSVLDADDVAAAVDGVTHVMHLAGVVQRDPKHAHQMFRLHIEGSRQLLEAVSPDVEKIVVASSSGTVGVSTSPSVVANDASPFAEQVAKRWPYYLSKIYAERVCDEVAAERNLPLVQLRPTLLLGPEDYRESSTGDVVLFLKQLLPAVLEGGLSFVDARDAADAFVTALDVAQPGEKYLLGAANMTLAEFFGALSHISGLPLPSSAVPGGVAEASSGLMTSMLRWLGTSPVVPHESVEMARHYWYIDWSRAERDLQFAPRDPMRTLRDTVRWLQRHHPDLAAADARSRSRV